jgi:hypothetical protein
MYENGRRVSNYYRKCGHKDHLKKKFLKEYSYGSSSPNMSFEEYLATRTPEQNNYYYGPNRKVPSNQKYWHNFDYSTARQEAKRATSRAIRNHYRQILSEIQTYLDYEDYEEDVLRGNEYQKFYDYDNKVW